MPVHAGGGYRSHRNARGYPPSPHHPAATLRPRRSAILPSRIRPNPAVLAAALTLILAATGAAAQEKDHPRDDDERHGSSRYGGNLAIFDLVPSVRAAGLGGAFSVAGNGGFAIFHHPALISGEGFALAAGTTGHRRGYRYPEEDCDREHDDRGYCTGDGGLDGPNPRGRVSHDDDDRHPDEDDYDDDSRGGATDLALSATGAWLGGTVAAGLALARDGAESLAAIGHARTLFGFRVGAAAKLVMQQGPEGGSSAQAGALDLGLAREFGWLTAVLTVQNLGPDLRHSDTRVPLTQRAVLAAATDRTPFGPLDVGGAFQVAVEREGRVVPGGGVEVSWWPVQRRVFVGRIGGLRTSDDGSPITFGAGFEGDRIRLDYAFIDADPALGPHRIGVAIR